MDSKVYVKQAGAWVDTPEGEDWFIHFQDVGNAGRIIHLQPVKWSDDWPVIGIDRDGMVAENLSHIGGNRWQEAQFCLLMLQRTATF